MDVVEYDRFTERLTARLADDERVLALVALGSTAAAGLRDEHSDHDFWLVVCSGAKDAFRSDVSWLPDVEKIISVVRQGAHYGTVLYESAHVAEFGVFEIEELTNGKLGRYNVVFDHGGVTAALAEVAAACRASAGRLDTGPECELLLITLLTGARRAARGETLSARKYIAYFAIDILLGLLGRRERPPQQGESDPLDPWRRFERVDPSLAAELRSTLRMPEVEAAARLVEIAERELHGSVADYPVEAAKRVKIALGGLRRLSENRSPRERRLSVTARRVSVLVCDLGKVLLPFDTEPVWRALLAACADPERARAAFHEEWMAAEMGKGRTEPVAFYERVAARMGLAMEYAAFCRAFSDMFWEDEEVIALVRELPVESRVLLSNTNHIHWEWITGRYPHVLAPFDRLVVSHECGLEKPDAAIYDHVSALTGRPPAEHLFIDDIFENVVGARARGWDAIHHTDAARLREALAARGLL